MIGVMMQALRVTGCFACLFWAAASAQDAPLIKPLKRAHAHNDYHHDRPLLDALDHGFYSVEADVFLVNGQLLVGHSPFELKAGRTLESLYLDPLLARVRSNGGRVHKDGPRFILLIDFKSAAGPTYEALRKVLPRYEEMLTRVDGDDVSERGVAIVVSGNRPVGEITKEKVRSVGIDGRMSDLSSDAPSHLIPMVSDAWRSQFTWNGEGMMPASEREKLRSAVRKAHDAGRVVRFWATPEKESVWRELLDADVDLINTDNLPGLARFLGAHAK